MTRFTANSFVIGFTLFFYSGSLFSQIVLSSWSSDTLPTEIASDSLFISSAPGSPDPLDFPDIDFTLTGWFYFVPSLPGDAIRIQLYEDAITDEAFFDTTFYSTVDDIWWPLPSPSISIMPILITNQWQDLQGAYRITAIGGPISMDAATFTSFYQSNFYSGDIVPLVPEPSTSCLIFIACMIVGSREILRNSRKRTDRWT